MSHFINLYLTIMVFQYLESTLHSYISCCYVEQTMDKLSGCQEQHLWKCMHKISEPVYYMLNKKSIVRLLVVIMQGTPPKP